MSVRHVVVGDSRKYRLLGTHIDDTFKSMMLYQHFEKMSCQNGVLRPHTDCVQIAAVDSTQSNIPESLPLEAEYGMVKKVAPSLYTVFDNFNNIKIENQLSPGLTESFAAAVVVAVVVNGVLGDCCSFD